MRELLLAFLVIVFLSNLSVSETAQAEPIIVAAIGDSNIAGKGVSSSDTYPAKLERALRAKGYDVRVLNSGINDDTAKGVLSRLGSAAPQGTKVAVVLVGINDLRAGVPAATVEADRQAIARTLRARGIGVILLGPRHGLASHPEYLQGDIQTHLNAADYDALVARTLPDVTALLERASQKHN
jgi:lysophospholipase L1-like esterase